MFNGALHEEPRGPRTNDGGFPRHLETLCFPWGSVIGPMSKTLRSVNDSHQEESSEAGLRSPGDWLSESQAESGQLDV